MNNILTKHIGVCQIALSKLCKLMQKIELGPVLNSQASAIWNKAKALGVTYAAFYADPDNSRQIIQLGPVSNSMASTLYSYAVNEMKVSYRSWYI